MKKMIIIFCIAFSNVIQAQEIEERLDENGVITIRTTNVFLNVGDQYSYARAAGLISKDTLLDPVYVLSICYKTPKDLLLDTTAVAEIRFSNGDLFSFNYSRKSQELIPKDSIVRFSFLTSYNCLNEMQHVPISDISFISTNYVHKIEIEDEMKLRLPNLANLLISNCKTEYSSILKEERRLNAPAIVFDSRGNKKIDKKYYGKFSGEWNCDNILYNFDLYITSDTSYINWFVIYDPNARNPNAVQTQVLNDRDLTENNNLILDVCFEPDKAEYTNGSRWYMLNLSQNGKVLYGLSVELDKYYGEMYGVKKKKYKK
jgi:hypothetical protein